MKASKQAGPATQFGRSRAWAIACRNIDVYMGWRTRLYTPWSTTLCCVCSSKLIDQLSPRSTCERRNSQSPDSKRPFWLSTTLSSAHRHPKGTRITISAIRPTRNSTLPNQGFMTLRLIAYAAACDMFEHCSHEISPPQPRSSDPPIVLASITAGSVRHHT